MKIKTLFISDIHLGNPNSQPKKLLKLLKKIECEKIFIVGDFIDMTYMKRKFYWDQSHSDVLRKILKMSKKGVKVTYITGNHDHYVRTIIEEGIVNFGDIELCDETIYTTSNGIKILVMHGDKFDAAVHISPFLYALGDFFYEAAIKVNSLLNFFRSIIGLEYWSLSAYLKRNVKNAIKFISNFKKIAREEVLRKNCDAILMGHIHTPEIEDLQGIKYYNSGDFVESCTYLVENLYGEIELFYCA